MFFPLNCGRNCVFEDSFNATGAAFTFDYAFPFAYLVDTGSGPAYLTSRLLIYNVADPASPTLVSTTALPAGSRGWNPRIYGDHLYIPYRNSQHLAIWNVADRAAPVLLGSVSLVAQPYCVVKIGDVAATGYGDGFLHAKDAEKIDVSDPTNPTVVASILVNSPSASQVTAIHATDSHFVLSGQNNSGGPVYIATVDIDTFLLTDKATDGGSFSGLFMNMVITEDGDHAFSTNTGNTFIASWDISDPANISLIDTAVVDTGTFDAPSLCLIDDTDRLYVGTVIIRIVDVSDPSNIAQVGNISTGGDSVPDMANIGGCPGLAYSRGTSGSDIFLLGTAPLS